MTQETLFAEPGPVASEAPQKNLARRVSQAYSRRVDMAKDERVYVRMNDALKAQARAVSKALGDESVSHTMRRLLRDKYRELFGDAEQPPQKRSPKKPKRQQ